MQKQEKKPVELEMQVVRYNPEILAEQVRKLRTACKMLIAFSKYNLTEEQIKIIIKEVGGFEYDR